MLNVILCIFVNKDKNSSTRVHKHLVNDKNFPIFNHLRSTSACGDARDETCFAMLNSTKTTSKYLALIV